MPRNNNFHSTDTSRRGCKRSGTHPGRGTCRSRGCSCWCRSSAGVPTGVGEEDQGIPNGISGRTHPRARRGLDELGVLVLEVFSAGADSTVDARELGGGTCDLQRGLGVRELRRGQIWPACIVHTAASAQIENPRRRQRKDWGAEGAAQRGGVDGDEVGGEGKLTMAGLATAAALLPDEHR